MKKIVFLSVLLCALVLCLVACDGAFTTTTTATTVPCTHEFSEWETIKEPPCAQEGIKIRVCALCEER